MSRDRLNRDCIATTWREALDTDLADALANLEDYEPWAQEVIRDEGERRHVAPALSRCIPKPAPLAILRVLTARASFLGTMPARIITALAIGVVTRILLDATPNDYAMVSNILFLSVLLPGLLMLLNYPWLSYSGGFLIGVVGEIGVQICGSWYYHRYYGSFTAGHNPGLILAGSAVVVAGFGLVCLIPVYIRRRFWPVYPSGQCQRCGYLLKGLTVPRCPECGKPFDWSTLSRGNETTGRR